MDAETILTELEYLGKERTKKIYISNGAREPLFGVATGAMKPLAKKVKNNQDLAEQLFASGNYDAMYFAGMIADPAIMTESDFERWIEAAYFYMLSDYVVAVTLAETNIAQNVSDQWIESGEELRMSAGWSCYCWLFGNRPDSEFDPIKITNMLEQIEETIHNSPERTKASMCNFVYTAAISFVPVHEKAVEIAKSIGIVEIKRENKKSSLVDITANILKDLDRGALGFKRKYVRC